MTRPWLTLLPLLLCLPAGATQSSGAPASDATRQQFLSHRPGEPLLDAAAFPLARQVEEGCELPCASPAETIAYLKKVMDAATELSLSAAESTAATVHYAPQGVPRKKSSAEAGTTSLAGAKLRPDLSTRLDARAWDIATGLGLARFTAAEGSIVGEDNRSPLPKGAAALDVPVLRAARKESAITRSSPPALQAGATPIDPATIDSRLGKSFNADIAKYPTGAAVLRAVGQPPELVIKKMASHGTTAVHSGKGSHEQIAINADLVADIVRRLDPGAAKVSDLANPAELRRYLAAHPALLPKVADAMDASYVHEMTHAAQYRRNGTGWLNDWKSGWVDIFNRGKYPVEMEWDAFGTQNRFFHEKAKADPSVLRLNGPFPDDVMEYTDYIDNLTKYRRDKIALYQGEVDTLDKLRLHSREEKGYYQAALAREQKQWPRRSVEGFTLMARGYNSQNLPTMGLPSLRAAIDRAAQGKFLEDMRPDLTAAFKEALSGIEARLAKAEADQKPWTIGGLSITLIKSLSADLKAPLPPRVAKAVSKR